MKNLLYVFAITVILSSCSNAKEANTDSIIPRPVSVESQSGHFKINTSTKLYTNLREKEKDYILSYFKHSDLNLQQANEVNNSNSINLVIVPTENKEEYTLNITSHSITIEAGTGAGIFYGVQSLMQLIDANGKDNIPAVMIKDAPRFAYRGFMLDVARHFYPKEFIKKQLDIMAYYKLNHFHWHFTDGAGWRIEIKKYPKLTSHAAWRPMEDYRQWMEAGRPFCTATHPTAYGGFYTQEDIKEIVQYAQERFITVIPEIEMPAHSEGVLTVYPHLSCSGKPGVNFEFCVGNEATFTFLEDVLTEIMPLFPAKFVHIGGDEAEKDSWKKCPKCQKRIVKEKLKNEDGLQSYLIHRIEDFLNKNEKDLLGWDEILEGGLAPNATVMTWRGEKGGIAAAQAGHRVIMTPNPYCYFDGYQDAPASQPEAMAGFLPLNKVYSYDPIPESLTTLSHLVLGVQANLWTEWIEKEDHVETMIYPRLLAMAEVAWTPLDRKDLKSFRERVLHANEYLKSKKVVPFDIANEVGPRKESLDTIKHLAYNKPTKYKYRYHDKYISSAEAAMTDGRRGDWSYSDKVWQGFLDTDFEVTINLEKVQPIHKINATFMQEFHGWIWMPAEVNIFVSKDNKNFELIQTIKNDLPIEQSGYHLKDFAWSGKTEAQYIRYQAKSSGRKGGWIFTDEIIVE